MAAEQGANYDLSARPCPNDRVPCARLRRKTSALPGRSWITPSRRNSMPHGPFAKRRRSPAACAVVRVCSPEGTKVNSPRRKPWVTAQHRTKPRRGGRDLSPLRGWAYSATRHPGLTPGAINFRPFGAISFRWLPRARRRGPGLRKTTVGFPTKPSALSQLRIWVILPSCS